MPYRLGSTENLNVVVVAALATLATAKPAHAIIAALLRKQPGRGLHPLSEIDPSSTESRRSANQLHIHHPKARRA